MTPKTSTGRWCFSQLTRPVIVRHATRGPAQRLERHRQKLRCHMASRLRYFVGSDQNVAVHDFRHSFDELEDIFPHPSWRNFIGGKRLIRAVEHADADEHLQPTLEQVIPPEAS